MDVRLRAIGAASDLFHAFALRHAWHRGRWHLHGTLHAALARREPLILAALHQDVVPLFAFLTRHAAPDRRRFVMLASRSFDGEVTARVLSPWGFRFVRGSSGRGGAAASVRALARALGEGASAVVVADGPRPPAGRLQPGPVFLARETGRPLHVVRAWARPQLLLGRTWFRMALPLPSSDFAVFGEGPLDVGGDLETARSRAERTLARLGIAADRHLYACSRRPRGVVLARAASRVL